MAHNYRNELERGRRGYAPSDHERGSHYQTGDDRDRYESGREHRYAPARERDNDWRGGGFEGNRRYGAGGYNEETGYRSSDFERLGWSQDEGGDEYYGTGVHTGGGYGTAPGSTISSSGSYGAPGYAGRGVWSEQRWPDEDLRHEQRGGYQSGASSTSFRGRGPKGYQRSDDRLKEMICERLTDDPRIDASDISVEVSQQRVTLNGTVEDRRIKYAVEDLVERCGATEVENRLRVRSSLR